MTSNQPDTGFTAHIDMEVQTVEYADTIEQTLSTRTFLVTAKHPLGGRTVQFDVAAGTDIRPGDTVTVTIDHNPQRRQS